MKQKLNVKTKRKKDETKVEEDDNFNYNWPIFPNNFKNWNNCWSRRSSKICKTSKLQVDLGEGRNRQILAGIKEYYSAEELVGTQACVVANLKPAKLMGMLSEGMLMAAKMKMVYHY